MKADTELLPSWPGAHAPIASARYKVKPSHFRVREIPLAAAAAQRCKDNSSLPHRLLEVEKCGINTTQAAALLAQWAGVPSSTVGYAGRKDRWAVTRQWFSLPSDSHADLKTLSVAQSLMAFASARLPAGTSFLVVGEAWQQRKLRPGDLLGNRFELTLKLRSELTEPRLQSALRNIAQQGVPNYFGPQRFGRENLAAARAWLQQRQDDPSRRRNGRRRRRGQSDGWHLSTLRAYLFNQVLAHRLSQSAGRQIVPVCGDVLAAGVPTGPLWGRGRSASTAVAAQLEQLALASQEQVRLGLEHTGVAQARRPMLVYPESLGSRRLSKEELRLSFYLPKGAYATVLLAELFLLQDASANPYEEAA